MQHNDLWKAIDSLADQHGLSASGLARRAGLDPTAFNKSKRVTPDGSPRWLSTESLSKALQAVGASLEDFAALAQGRQGHIAPLLGFAKAGSDGCFDDAGFPTGDNWEEVRFPGLETENVYALEKELAAYPAPPAPRRERNEADAIALNLEMKIGTQVLSFITTTTIFGTPADVTLSELCLETFFPANAETAAAMKVLAGG